MWIPLFYTLTALSFIDSSPHKCSAGCQKINKVIPSLNRQRETTQFEGGSPLYWWQNSENAFGDDCSNTPEGCLFDGNTKSSIKFNNPSLKKQTLSTKFHSFPKSQSASSSSVQNNRRHLNSVPNLNTQFNLHQRDFSAQTHSSKINRRPNAVPALLDSYNLPAIDNPTNTAIDKNYQSESIIGFQLPTFQNNKETFQNNKETFENSQIDFSFGTPFSNEKITPTIKRTEQFSFTPISKPRTPQFSLDKGSGVIHQEEIIRKTSQKRPRPSSLQTTQITGFRSSEKHKQSQHKFDSHTSVLEAKDPVRKRPHTGSLFTSKTPFETRKQPSPFSEPSHQTGFSTLVKQKQPQTDVHVSVLHQAKPRPQSGSFYSITPYKPHKQPSPSRKTSQPTGFSSLSKPKQPTGSLARPKHPQSGVHVWISNKEKTRHPLKKIPQTGAVFTSKTPSQQGKQPSPHIETFHGSGFSSLSKPKKPQSGVHVDITQQTGHPFRRPEGSLFTSKIPSYTRKKLSPHKETSHQAGFSPLAQPKQPQTDVHVGVAHQAGRPSEKRTQTGSISSKTPYKPQKHPLPSRKTQQSGFSSFEKTKQPQTDVHVDVAPQAGRPLKKRPQTGAVFTSKIPSHPRQELLPHRKISQPSGFSSFAKPRDPQRGLHVTVPHQAEHPSRKRPQTESDFTSKTPYKPQKQPLLPSRKTSQQPGFTSLTRPKGPKTDVHVGLTHQTRRPSGKRAQLGSVLTSKTPQQIKEPSFDKKSPQTGFSSLGRQKHPQSGAHVSISQQTRHPSRKIPQRGVVFTSPSQQQRKQPSPYKEKPHYTDSSSLTKPKQPQSGVHTGISQQTGHPLRRPQGSLITYKIPSQTRKQPLPSRKTSHQPDFSSLAGPKQPHTLSNVHTSVSEETLKPLSDRVLTHIKSETDHPSFQETPSYSPHILSTGSEDNFPSRVRPRDENKLFAPSHPPTFLQSKPSLDLTQHEINTRFTSLSFTQPKLPVSSGSGNMGGSPMGSGGMMGGMMMMLTTLKGTTLSPRRRCSAGSYCVTIDECDLYTGFIIFNPFQLRDEIPKTPKVPTVACSIPAEQQNGICCSLPHPLIGADGKIID